MGNPDDTDTQVFNPSTLVNLENKDDVILGKAIDALRIGLGTGSTRNLIAVRVACEAIQGGLLNRVSPAFLAYVKSVTVPQLEQKSFQGKLEVHTASGVDTVNLVQRMEQECEQACRDFAAALMASSVPQ